MIIKIIWDFRGEDSEQIAIHHAVHLKEFCIKESLLVSNIAHAVINDFHTIAFIETEKKNMVIIRDVLKPHRAEVVND
jgi:hypothetical protein